MVTLQMLNETVESGLSVIHNCAWSSPVRPDVSEQALSTLSIYLDPDTNDPYIVISCIIAMELLEMRDQLCRRDWPDPILQAVSGLLTRTWYDQEQQGFMAPSNQDGSGVNLLLVKSWCA